MSDSSILAPETASDRVQILVGVLLDDRVQEGWVLEALRQALAVPGVRPGVVAITSPGTDTALASRLHRMVDRMDLHLQCRDEHLFSRVDVVAALNCPLLDIPVASGEDSWSVEEAGIAALRAAQVDVWLCFTATPPQLLPSVSRFGVWGLEIGVNVPATNIWAGAVEVGARSNVTMARVVDYAQPNPHLLYRGYGATIKNSARRNRLLALRKALSFFKRALLAATRSSDSGARLTTVYPPLPLNYPVRREPTVPAVLQLSWRLTAQVASNRWHKLGWRDQWQIGYYFADESEDPGRPPAQMRSLVPPKERDWADPFVVERDGRYFIYFEELLYPGGKARISVIEVFENAEPGAPRPVLERPYHLSYPFIFEWGGELFMMPETGQNRTVELYRCDEFPTRWSFHQVLLEGIHAVDATLWRDRYRWWLFVNIAEPGADPSEELHLYWSNSPMGPWTAHRANPVISDARCARGAGPMFMRGGVLYRPSQDCSFTYGHAISINRVVTLNTERYEETPVDRISTAWRDDMLAVHTFGAGKRLRVIDYQVRRSKWVRGQVTVKGNMNECGATQITQCR